MKPGDPGFRHEWLKQVLAIPGHHAWKVIAGGLWTFADHNGFCYPNIQQIAQRTGSRSDSRISEHIRGLANAGCIGIRQEKAASGWSSNNYQLVLPTSVGTSSSSLSGPIGPERQDKKSELAPTQVGAV